MGQLLKADDAGDLFDQIFFDFQIKAKAWRHHFNHAGAFFDLQAKTFQSIRHCLLTQVGTQHFVGPGHAHSHRCWLWHVCQVIIHRADLHRRCCANRSYQCSDVFNMLDSAGRVHTAFEAMSGIGGKVETTRSAGNRRRPPESGFKVNIGGAV
jgi:hypothetical protein